MLAMASADPAEMMNCIFDKLSFITVSISE
jgi:hypothetical protein